VLKTTPFHARTAALCASHAWRRWAGHVVASSYELSHEREYHAIRSAAALLDISPLYKYLVRGKDAARLLDRVMTRDVARSQPGQVLYTPWCDGAGKVLDDGTVTRLDEERFRVTSAEPNLRWFQDNALGLAATVSDISDSIAALALQGPTARAILEQVCDADVARLKYFRMTEAKLRGVPVTITRTGYTGDLGYEIWMDAPDALAVWDALIEAGTPYGITPAGMLALDLARIEAGLMLLDVDYVPANKALIESQTSSPFELDLGWAVNLDKAQFVGIQVDWDAFEALFLDVGLAPRVPSIAWRMSVPLYAGGEQAGYGTSGGWSPILKQYLVLAHLRSRWAAPGTTLEMEVTVEHRRKRAVARVAKKPFFNPERKRT
jgi:aminomethyltransferase